MSSNEVKIEGLSEKDSKLAINSIRLLEGEKIKQMYACQRSIEKGKKKEIKKGLFVITDNNLLFQQQEGTFSKHFHTALRIPLTQIHGITSGGKLIKHIRILAGIGGSLTEHEFVNFYGARVGESKNIHEIRDEIENTITKARQEQAKLAKEAVEKGKPPIMIFCRYCGARSPATSQRCSNCGATL